MSNSILTNTSAMAALQTLRSINESLDTTQNSISSGLKVASASDNAAYWSIATTMKSDNGALSAVSDALGLGASTVDTAYTGMNSAIDLVSQIKNKLVAAEEPGVDKSKIQKDITQLQGQLKSIADSSSFNGQNWLSQDLDASGFVATQSIVGSFTRGSDNSVTVQTLDYTLSGSTVLFGGATTTGILDTTTTTTGGAAMTKSVSDLDISGSTVDNTDIGQLISFVDKQLGAMTDAASNLGSLKSRITSQSDFVSKLMDSLDSGVGRLVDADMNKELTKLKALQTQQQLGIQALSIANSNSQSILSLFR